MDIRFESEVEFRKFAARQKREYEKIQIRVTEAVLTGKWFVNLYLYCKDFPGGTYDHVATFVTTDEQVALRLMDLSEGSFGERGLRK